VIDAFRAAISQGLGEEIGLFLVVAFQADAVARLDDGFEQVDDTVDRDFLAIFASEAEARRPFKTAATVLAQAIPLTGKRCVHDHRLLSSPRP
jgi:V8-like Glu-specific endopeptidase